MPNDKKQMPVEKAHRIISPRIAYIVTSIDKQGRVNAGTFSNLTSVSTEPERLVLAVFKPWDTVQNLQEIGEFVVNVPSKNMIEQAWTCGDKYAGNPIPRGIDELKVAGLTEIPAEKVKPPRIAECSSHLECKVVSSQDVGDHIMFLADIVAASFTEGAFNEEYIQDISKTMPLMELSRGSFTFPERVLEVDRAKVKNAVATALERMNVQVSDDLRQYGKFSEE